MNSRGTSVGWGQEDGRGVGGKVWRGKEVKRRRTGEGIGNHGRGGVVISRVRALAKESKLKKFAYFGGFADRL
jgi:hypothetical protein